MTFVVTMQAPPTLDQEQFCVMIYKTDSTNCIHINNFLVSNIDARDKIIVHQFLDYLRHLLT